MDSGPVKTVTGVTYWRGIDAALQFVTKLLSRGIKFSFRKIMCNTTESALVNIPLLNVSALSVDAVIVPVDVPFLLGLTFMCQLGLTLDFSSSTVRGKSGWMLPLVYEDGQSHLMQHQLKRAHPVHWTKEKPLKLHLQFSHPSVGNCILW